MNKLILGAALLSVSSCLALAAVAGEAEKVALRYKFHPNETIRWQVQQRSMVRATVSRSTQSTETLSNSVNVWRVFRVQPDGSVTFEQSVEWVDMRQTLSGRGEVRYDSRTGAKPPQGFEDAAKSVGVPLSVITMDAQGKVLHRKDRAKKPQAPGAAADSTTPNEGWITIPLPMGSVPVGHAWSIPEDIEVPLPSGAVKKIKAVQKFVLEEVKTGVAVIRVSTEVLTPITDAAIESQLIQREAAGAVRFDIDAGRIISEQMDIDKNVVGFHGDASSIHYVNRFSEHLLAEPARR
jgi:hypothetical protein